MKQETITYKPQSPDFMYNGFRHTQLCREGDVAIFHKVAEKTPNRQRQFDVGFEVVVISRHDGYTIGGVKIEPSEVYPGNEKWGSMGWSYPTLLAAENRFSNVLNGEITIDDSEPDKSELIRDLPTRRHRRRKGTPMPTLQIPDEEFTMQTLAELNDITKPNAYIRLKSEIASGTVSELRRESRGKGRPTVIYTRINK